MNDDYMLVRKPLDPVTGKDVSECRYALFPGLSLARSEPDLVVLLYDSILHQHEDTAMFLYPGRDRSDPLLNRKWSERLLTKWRNLGKPTLFIVTPEDRKFLRGVVPEIPTRSLYQDLLDHNISGGCSRELYRLVEPEGSPFGDEVRELAENMGAVLYDRDEGSSQQEELVSDRQFDEDGHSLHLPSSDLSRIPFLTSSMDLRNSLKQKGFEAVHILELIYGMGESNQHLAHSHEGSHDHDTPPQVRDATMSPEEKQAQERLFSPQAQKESLKQLHQTLMSLFWNQV